MQVSAATRRTGKRLKFPPKRSIVKELGYVKEKQNRGTIRRYLEAGGDADKVFACYRRIQGHLYRLLVS